MQGMKPASAMGDLHSSMVNEMNNVPSKLNQYSPVQGRTIDLMNLSPVSQGYGSPLVYSAPTPPSADSNALAYGHSFFKPPPVTPIPVTLVPQHQPHSIIHPWLVPHLLPHIMPHLMPNLMPSWMPHLSSYVPPHRIETYNYLEPPKNDVKQPPPSIPHYSYVSPDSALICQPVRNQRFDNSFDYIYKPDAAADKSFNVSESGSKNQESSEDERKIKDNLRKVNEIKDEITKLNRAAQRIVDQQERLTEMHQKQLWGGSSSVSTMQGANHMPHPYMGTGYFAHPTMPWGYSRSNILSYPNSHDDIDFFMNLLNAGKKIGIVSNSLQPNTAVSESEKGSQQPDKNKKEQTENADSKQEALKTNSNERKRK